MAPAAKVLPLEVSVSEKNAPVPPVAITAAAPMMTAADNNSRVNICVCIFVNAAFISAAR
jgi:hypothetical protein